MLALSALSEWEGVVCKSILDIVTAVGEVGIPHSVSLAMVCAIGEAEPRREDRLSSAGRVETSLPVLEDE